MPAIAPGAALPALTVKTVAAGAVADTPLATLFGHGRHILFGLPGAFTPTCSAKHLPGYIAQAAALRAAGIGTIACLSVNDAFVMQAWAAQQGADQPGGVVMIADGNGELTRALGLELDARAYGMGMRCQRFAMVVRDGVAERVLVEAPGAFAVSAAEHVLHHVREEN